MLTWDEDMNRLAYIMVCQFFTELYANICIEKEVPNKDTIQADI